MALFSSLRGVSVDQAAEAAESWHASRAVRDLHVQLAPHGLAHLAAPIHARFGESSMTVLHEDPYRLTEVDGVGFARADKIALAADVPPESSRRAQAAAVYVLGEAEQQGNSFLPIGELTARTARLIGLAADPEVLCEADGLVVEEGRIYRKLTHASELAVGRTLPRAQRPAPHRPRPGRVALARRRRDRADRRAVVCGAGRLRLADLGAHRRPRRRQDGLHAGAGRGGGRSATCGSPSARRPGARPAASRRRRGTQRRRSIACSSGARAASRPSSPATPCPPTW